MHELVVISGKGGTGKTSVTASFAALARRPVIADCDVDAADLHLVLRPDIQERHMFHSGQTAEILQEHCVACGACATHCRFDAVRDRQMLEKAHEFYIPAGASDTCNDCDYCKRSCLVKSQDMLVKQDQPLHQGKESIYSIDPIACEGCGVCALLCESDAIHMREAVAGEWFVSKTDCGPMVHARLGIAAENSGKLVSTVRQQARRIAQEHQANLILVDGPPGIGCPVIASITGASLLLVVTEPTLSGRHDLKRVLSLARHFKVPAAVCVNKWDLNPGMTETIEQEAAAMDAALAGRICYDTAVTQAQLKAQPVVALESDAANDVRMLWKRMKDIGAHYGFDY